MSKERIAALERDVATKQAEIDRLKKIEISYTKLHQITSFHKAQAFDQIHHYAVDYLKRKADEGSCAVEDHPQYMMELVLKLCLGEHIFRDVLNHLRD